MAGRRAEGGGGGRVSEFKKKTEIIIGIDGDRGLRLETGIGDWGPEW